MHSNGMALASQQRAEGTRAHTQWQMQLAWAKIPFCAPVNERQEAGGDQATNADDVDATPTEL